MDEAAIAEVLHRAAETHHVVFGIVDGADDDWASWYSQWLTTLSELPSMLGKAPVRSELTYLLVKLDNDFTSQQGDDRWEDFYAREIARHFA